MKTNQIKKTRPAASAAGTNITTTVNPGPALRTKERQPEYFDNRLRALARSRGLAIRKSRRGHTYVIVNPRTNKMVFDPEEAGPWNSLHRVFAYIKQHRLASAEIRSSRQCRPAGAEQQLNEMLMKNALDQALHNPAKFASIEELAWFSFLEFNWRAKHVGKLVAERCAGRKQVDCLVIECGEVILEAIFRRWLPAYRPHFVHMSLDQVRAFQARPEAERFDVAIHPGEEFWRDAELSSFIVKNWMRPKHCGVLVLNHDLMRVPANLRIETARPEGRRRKPKPHRPVKPAMPATIDQSNKPDEIV